LQWLVVWLFFAKSVESFETCAPVHPFPDDLVSAVDAARRIASV